MNNFSKYLSNILIPILAKTNKFSSYNILVRYCQFHDVYYFIKTLNFFLLATISKYFDAWQNFLVRFDNIHMPKYSNLQFNQSEK